MFSAQQAINDASLAPFSFEDSKGQVREVPHMKALSLEQGERLLLHGEVKEVLDEVAPEVGTEVATWPAHVVEDFFREWQAHSDVQFEDEPGKSSASSPRSASTAARSKRTSRSAGSRSRR
jgi:hypothetical protein